jgi:hypothetical protein
MRFVRVLDAIFELTAIVRELLGDFVGPARYIATDCGPKHYGLAYLESVGGHPGGPCLEAWDDYTKFRP